jgi:hypothetical protein
MGSLNKLLPPKIKRNDSGVARRSSLARRPVEQVSGL